MKNDILSIECSTCGASLAVPTDVGRLDEYLERHIELCPGERLEGR